MSQQKSKSVDWNGHMENLSEVFETHTYGHCHSVCCRGGDTEQYTVNAFRSSQSSVVILPVLSWINPVNGPAYMSGGKTRQNYEQWTKDQFVVSKILTVTLGSLHWSIHWWLVESFQIRAKRSCLFAANTRIKYALIFMCFVCILAQAHRCR